MAVIDFFDRGRTINAHGVAYRDGSSTWTFDEAGDLSCRIGHALIAANTHSQTKIAVLSPNSALAWICVLGIWRAGATWVPLNPNHPVADNAALMDRFDVEVVFYCPSLGEQVDKLRDQLGGVGLWIAIVAEAEAESLSLMNWVASHPCTMPAISHKSDQVVAIAPTGGTTGQQKGVMNTNRSFSVMVAHQLLALTYPADAPVVNLAAAPMTHTAGIFSLQASARGGTVVIIPSANANSVLRAIEAHRITELFLPPTVIYRILEQLEDQPTDTSSLRYLMYGAAPMSVQKLRRGIDLLGPVFIEGYGQMEAPAAISFLRPDEHFIDGSLAPDSRLASCGRPYPLVRVAILDPESREEVERGVIGEICVRGDLVMKGYYKDDDRTAETIIDGWLHTGDLGTMDSDGYLRITDRNRDLIISGGLNIYPGEVEQVLWSHAAVRDCAVVGAPHEDWGEAVTAVVELNEGAEVTEAELIEVCRQTLGSVRTPKQVIFVEQLPRSANGKVLKKDVRAELWASQDRRI